MTTLHLRKSIGAVHLAQLLGVCRGYCFCSSRRICGKGHEMIRQKSSLLGHPSYYPFASWLFAACLLTGSAVATKAKAQELTILATGQAGAGNIIVDGSRVYWINNNNSRVSSVDKLNGGVVFIHNPANNVPGGNIVQDNGNLYFASETGPFLPSVWNLYSVPKFSSIVHQLTVDTVNTETTTSGSGRALGISNGSLYYFGGLHSINCPGSRTYNPNYPDNCNDNRTIQKISTQGGTPAQVIPLASFPNLNIAPGSFDTDSVYLHWSDLNAILRVPLVGGLSYSSDANAPNGPGYLRTPTTGPAGGYHFWVEGAPNAVLREQTPGGAPFTLLNGLENTGFNSFVQVGSFVYCVMRFQTNGTITGIPINGGTPIEMVDAVHAFVPLGLTSDGTYLYWTASGDGSIRRSTIPPTTNAATNVAAYSATLNGSVNPGGLTTSVYFQYGPTTGYGFTTPVQTQTGNTFRNISANISALSANHGYHFRIVAHNSAGTGYGGDRTFTTLTATGLPVVTISPATLIASFSATLNGSLDPHGLTTSVYFQYGTTTNYGLTTAPQSQSGNTYRNISANISSLSASTTYHFRIVASNSAGTTFGGDRTLTTLTATGAPVVTTNAATNVAISSATLNGSLDPHGLTTSVYFQYGTTTSYGHTTAMQSQTGNTYRNITANISGLTTHTTYHFRILATNNAGTRFGSDRTFTTP